MSDYSIAIVPKLSKYPNKEEKVDYILDWLITGNIIKPILTDCVLSSDKGYPVSDGARSITTDPDFLPFDLITNGLEIVASKQVFHTDQNDIEKIICPSCNSDLGTEDWSFFTEWQEDENSTLINCPICKKASDIHQFVFTPEWGFSDLGFIFWNWPGLTDSFVNEFKNKLGCDVNLVFTRI